MNGKYIIILLFIFLVFLMGSINSTITNNFYNNTTGSQDHFNLTNLSYDDSGHTGFQSSDTLNDDVSALGYVTNATMASDNKKVNKTGDELYIIYNNNSESGKSFKSVDINQTTNLVQFNKIDSYVNGSTGSEMSTNIPKFSYVFNRNMDSDSNTNNLVQFWSVNNVSWSTSNFFQGVRTRGSIDSLNRTATLYPCEQNDVLFYVSGASISRGAFPSGSRMYFRCSQNWNDSQNGEEIVFTVTKNDSISNNDAMIIGQDSNVTITGLAGSGTPRPLCEQSGRIIVCP